MWLGLLPLIQVPQTGDPNIRFRLLAPKKGLPWLRWQLHLWIAVLGIWSWLDHISVPPTLLNVAFFSIFSCKKYLLLIFMSFSEIVLYVVVVFMCLWKEVSWGSSYSTILTPVLVFLFIFVLNSRQNWSFEGTAFFLYLV